MAMHSNDSDMRHTHVTGKITPSLHMPGFRVAQCNSLNAENLVAEVNYWGMHLRVKSAGQPHDLTGGEAEPG